MGEYAEMSMDTWDIDDQIDEMYRYRSIQRNRREQWHNQIRPTIRYMVLATLIRELRP